MTGKESRSPHKQPASADVGSIADRIASALTSTQTQTRAHVAGLPLAPLILPMPPASLYCAVTPIDDRGRLADRSPIRAMKWQPQQLLNISANQGIVIVVTQSDGSDSITQQGHLRLPAHIRNLCRITAGDRLLMAAAPGNDLIVVYVMSLLESILLKHQTSASAARQSK